MATCRDLRFRSLWFAVRFALVAMAALPLAWGVDNGVGPASVCMPHKIDQIQGRAPRTVQIGTSNYQILRLLGKGAFGRVYLLKSPSGTKVVAKVSRTGELRQEFVNRKLDLYNRKEAAKEWALEKFKGNADERAALEAQQDKDRKNFGEEALKELHDLENYLAEADARFMKEYEHLELVDLAYDSISNDAQIRPRFVRAMGGVQETNLGGPTFLMEYIEKSRTLSDVIETTQTYPGAFEDAEVAKVGMGLGEALAITHDADISHRDLKPANVLVDTDGEPRLIDFGLSADAEGRKQDQGTPLGTPIYMSADAWRGRQLKENDLFALGVVLYQMKTGEEPFSGSTVNQLAFAVARMEDPHFPRPRPSRGPLASAWIRFFDKFWSPKVEERYRDGMEVKKALQAVMATLTRTRKTFEANGRDPRGPRLPRQEPDRSPGE